MKSLTLCMAILGYAQFSNADNCTIYINSVTNNHNVGIYECDANGVCLLIDSRYDAESDGLALQPDEVPVDLDAASTNSTGMAQQTAKSGALLNNCNFGGGNGGSGGSITLPEVVTTAWRSVALYEIRRIGPISPGTGNGGSTPSGAAKKEIKVPVKSQSPCFAEQELRHTAAFATLGTLGLVPSRAPVGTIFVVTTADGFPENWRKVLPGQMVSRGQIAFESSTCESPGL